MVLRRDRIDPDSARVIEQRLQWLLQESSPRSPDPEGADETGSAADSTDRTADRRRFTMPQSAQLGRRFRRPHLVVVLAIVVLGLMIGGWALVRSRPVALAVSSSPANATPAAGDTTVPDSSSPAGTNAASNSPAADGRTTGGAGVDHNTGGSPPAAGQTSPASSGGSGSSAGQTLVVHVLGAVRKPGLVRIPTGSRVQAALEAAGGLTRRADPGELNLAQVVGDGQQIFVGTRSRPAGEVRDGAGPGSVAGGAGGGPGSGAAGAGGAGTAGPVNLNTANQSQLEELPGVGPVMAGKILAWRSEHGRFSRVAELQEIDGVGPKTYAKLAPLCRV